MSRYYEGDGSYDDWDELRAWANTNGLERSLKGKRGLQVLQDLEQALLALPAPRLIANAVSKDGEFCAVGAFARHKGVDLSRVDGYEHEDCDIEETTKIGESAGMQKTLAWDLAYRNDEIYWNKTPEERFTAILSWTREKIRVNPYYVA